MRGCRLPAVLAAVLVRGTMAHACTVCGSGTGERVRAGLFDGHFGWTLLMVALPFPVFAVVLGLLPWVIPEVLEAEDDVRQRGGVSHE